MSSKSLEEEYFNWLVDQVNASKYSSLCEQLYNTSFNGYIPNDDNREEDGVLLRTQFLDEFGLYSNDDWISRQCSMLELILGISYRLSYDSNMDMDAWFWELLDNLKLSQYSNTKYDSKQVNVITKKLNNRTYKSNGDGGLFPLKSHNEDQRKIEIWYQMSAYLLENNLLS